MGNFNGKFGSAKQDWETPQDMFDRLNEEYRFEVDLAASEKNAKCSTYYSAEQDAMKLEWRGRCWLNPPYGATEGKLRDWVKKAYEETRKDGCMVVMLIPARTNTNWWHEYCMKAREIRFLQGRPKFGDASHGLPQPLALVVFEKTGQDVELGSFVVNN